MLAGIVNRMDRAYVSEESCGEIRLIYRLARFDTKPDGSKTATRLPMTLNLVMKARDSSQIDPGGKAVSCADIARRWLDNGDWQGLIGSRFQPYDAMLDRIETNIQLSIAPKSALHDFRSDYLLKVFKYDAVTKQFAESTLENQIDRDRILADDALRRDFKSLAAHAGEFARLRSRHGADPGEVSRQGCNRTDARGLRCIGLAAGVRHDARGRQRGRQRVSPSSPTTTWSAP